MNNGLEIQLKDITQKIIEKKLQKKKNILELGNLLIEAKEHLLHGQWSKWLEEEVDFSQSTANKFMKCAKEFLNSESVRNLGSNKLFQLLSVSKDKRDEFINGVHEIKGQEKTIYDMSTRELQQVIKNEKQVNIKLKENKSFSNVSNDEIVDDEQRLEQVILERQKLEEQLKLKQQQAKEIKENILMNKKSLNLAVEFEEVIEDGLFGKKILSYNIYLVRDKLKELLLEKSICV